ncbi:MAG: PadR family transcriptional regulator [Bacteroidales bacterium]|nr:PadR family transcriptional regulator [Bacteroidales bacterium]
MSLKHAILGFLNNQDLTGYDLQKRIEKTINHFWSSTQSQIYRTLKELIDNELVEMQMVYQDDKPNRKNYTITPKGKEELTNWLNTSIEIPNHRNQFLVQFFFSDNIDNLHIIKNLEHYKTVMQQRLNFLNQFVIKQKNKNNDRPQKLYNLIAENGIRALENEIGWIDYAIKTIKDEE